MVDARELALLSLLGGVLAVDRTAFLQSMVSRPLAGATLAGSVVGEPGLGLLCGALLELLWLMDLPVGASVPPDESLAGVLAPVLAACSPEPWSIHARAALGILAALPFGFVGRRADVFVRRRNGGLLERARCGVAAGGVAVVGRAHLLGAFRFFVAGAAAVAVGSVAGGWAVHALSPLGGARLAAAMELVETSLPFVGAAAVLAGLGLRRYGAWFGAAFLALLALERGGVLRGSDRGVPWRR